ncbi:hypothetical protein SBV42_00915 [Chlamydia crocodili]|uniref:Uncharacterized protein n=1 Tax=Chlamydia crocodili TaxID=2766982 RepID=A0ABX8CH80_9CHLA|nr:hypothetical protein [Chlamydia crocodili]QVE49331.1 hypothetical protein H9Q19_01295 [Chlamydia crocodili]
MTINLDNISIENQIKPASVSVNKSRLVHIAHIVAGLSGVALFGIQIALLILFYTNPSSILLVLLVVSMVASLLLLYVAIDYFMSKYSLPIELQNNTVNQ